MVIGRGRRREHPNQHFVLLLLEKIRQKIRENDGGKKYEKKDGKLREKIKGKSHVTSDDITSGQACAMVISSGSSTNAN